jgi:hypothetical protein
LESVTKNHLDFTPPSSPGAFVEQLLHPPNERHKLISNEAPFLRTKFAVLGGNNQTKHLCQIVPEEAWQFVVF